MTAISGTNSPSPGFARRYSRVLGEGLWAGGAQVTTAVLMLVGTRLITQYVAPSLFGTFNLIFNMAILARTVFCTPVTTAAMCFYPDAVRDGNVGELRRVVRRLLIRATSFVSVGVLAVGLAFSRYSHTSVWVPVLLATIIGFDLVRNYELAFCNAARRQRPFAISMVLDALLRPVLIVVAAIIFRPSLETMFAAIAISYLIVALVLYFGVAWNIPADSDNVNPAELSTKIIRYALPLAPVSVLIWVTAVSDRYIIGWLTKDASHAVGIYAAGYGLISAPFIMTSGIVAQVIRPIYFTAVSSGSAGHSRKLYAIWAAIVVGVSAIGLPLSFFLRHWLVSTFLARPYQEAERIIPWIALGYFFYVIEQVLEYHLLAQKRTWALLASQIVGAIASIIITIPLVFRFGWIGAAYACPIYFLIQALTNVILIQFPPKLPRGT